MIMTVAHRLYRAGFILACLSGFAAAQNQAGQQPGQTSVSQPADDDKRAFGLFPNYRTAEASAPYSPLTVKRKFEIGALDSFDFPTVLFAGVVAGIGQMADYNPSFGQGGKGYARRFGTAYGDQAIANLLSESVLPSMLHEDPRYFRRGTGSGWSRTGYALSQIFVTRTDSGGKRFNTSEIFGNAMGAGIANAYYPDGRHWGSNLGRFGGLIGFDAASQILREFLPDIRRKLFQKH